MQHAHNGCLTLPVHKKHHMRGMRETANTIAELRAKAAYARVVSNDLENLEQAENIFTGLRFAPTLFRKEENTLKVFLSID